MSDVVELQTEHVSGSVHVPDVEAGLDLIYPGPGPGDDTGGAGGGGHQIQDIRRVTQMRLGVSETRVF